MKKISVVIQSLSVLIILAAGCGRPDCENTNAVFNKFSPETQEYKEELMAQISRVKKSERRYWMDTYEEKDAQRYIHAYVQGDGLCAKIVLTVRDSEKGIEDILKNKGMGYSGAELEGLEFINRLDRVSGFEFVFQEVSGIDD
jgi:hypothetical protein